MRIAECRVEGRIEKEDALRNADFGMRRGSEKNGDLPSSISGTGK
jgi:hypothetical protein